MPPRLRLRFIERTGAIRRPALLVTMACAVAAAFACSESERVTDPTPEASSSTSAPAEAAGAAVPSITIDAVGDVSLAREVAARMEAAGPAYPFARVAGMIDGDVNIANLEGPLTDGGEPWPKGYNFRTPPRFASALTAGHLNVVTLANNHIMDYGREGLADTIGALDAAGVRHVGAGADADAAYAPAIIEMRGIRVAVLGYVATPEEASGFSISQWAAGPSTSGVAIGTRAAVAEGARAAKRDADFVVVCLHAGTEYDRAPDATQRALAEAALSAGADAVVGAHAHVVQPVERRGGQLVAWGLGNFVFDLDDADLASVAAPRVAPILKLTVTKGAGVTSLDAAPVTLEASEDRPRPATAEEGAILREQITPR